MGTNFFLHENVCNHCGRSDKPLHIGKSSSGWTFALHVIPGEGLNSLEDWKKRWSYSNSEIRDEYGELFSPEEMLKRILERKSAAEIYRSTFIFDRWSEPGPNGLIRSKIDGVHCIGHGDGSYDLMAGEFS